MRKMSKKIIVSVLTLVLTVVALGTTTYAWFTVGGTVAVEDFDMQVTSGVGLEIAYLHKNPDLSVNDPNVSYVKTINANDLYAYLYLDYYDYLNGDDSLADVRGRIGDYADAWKARFTMDAFTSADGVTLMRIPENLPEDLDLNAQGIQFVGDDPDNFETWYFETHGFDAADKTHGFIEFTLAFRTKEAPETKLYLNDLTYNSTGVEWRPEIEFTKVGGTQFLPNQDKELFRAVNGARISITDDEEGTTIVYEKPENGNINKVLNEENFIWNQGAHSYYLNVTNRNLQDYYEGYKAVETKTSLDGGIQEVAKFVESPDVNDTYSYAKVTIRIYLEGFDSETFNAIFEDVIKARFGFNIDIE